MTDRGDFFGIDAGVVGAINVYFRACRATGRTTSMIENLADGDQVVFTDAQEARRIERLCRIDGKRVRCLVLQPHERLPDLLRHGTPKGRTLLDHSLVERLYEKAVARTSEEINAFQRETSGYGAPHRETRRAAIERSKWT